MVHYVRIRQYRIRTYTIVYTHASAWLCRPPTGRTITPHIHSHSRTIRPLENYYYYLHYYYYSYYLLRTNEDIYYHAYLSYYFIFQIAQFIYSILFVRSFIPSYYYYLQYYSYYLLRRYERTKIFITIYIYLITSYSRYTM